MTRTAANAVKVWSTGGLLALFIFIGCTEILRDGPPIVVKSGMAFRLLAPAAAQVSLVGSFNQWNLEASPLRRISSDGLWEVVVSLPPGRYQYMFVIDGKWVTPPHAPLYLRDGFGRQNGLLIVE